MSVFDAPYDPNESFQLRNPFESGPGQSPFPDYQQPPAYQPEPMPAPAIGGASWDASPEQWSQSQAIPGGPISYTTDQPLVMDFSGGAGALPPEDQARATAFDQVFPGGGGASGADPFAGSAAATGGAGGSPLDPKASMGEALRLNREQGQSDITQAQMGADLMKRKSDFETNTQIEQEQLRAKYQSVLAMAKETSERKVEAYKNLKPDTLFGSGSRGGQRETTIALMILGGINDVMGNNQGQASSAMQALQIGMKQLETDDSIRFGKALNDAKGAQHDVQTLEAQRDVGLAEIAHRNAARWKVVEDGVKAELAQMAPGEAKVKAEQNALLIQQKTAQEIQRAQASSLELAEKGMRLEIAARKLRGGGGAGRGAAAPGRGDGSDGGPMDIRTVLNSKGEPIGMAPGSAKVSTEGQKARAMYSQLEPVREGLKTLRDKVAGTGTIDRFSGGLSDNQQEIEGIANMLVNPITQATGGGVAQEAEARRQLKTVRVGALQNKDVTLTNIDNLLGYVERMYDAKVRSLVPSSTAEQRAGGPVQPPPRSAGSGGSAAPGNPQDQAALDWANANPGDPRAAKIRARLGM